jgi:hypothetical protein
VRLAAQHDRPADDRPIRIERADPQCMAQHGYGWTVHAILLVGELATQLGRDAEHSEEAGRRALLRH